MDKVLSKLGVTIERRSKPNPAAATTSQPSKPLPNLPPGVTLQKKTDVLGGLTLPKGVTVQYNTSKTLQEPVDEGVNPKSYDDDWQENDDEYEDEDEYTVNDYNHEGITVDKSSTDQESRGSTSSSKTGLGIFGQLNIPKGLTIAPPKKKALDIVSPQHQRSRINENKDFDDEYEESVDQMDEHAGSLGTAKINFSNSKPFIPSAPFLTLPPTAFPQQQTGPQGKKVDDSKGRRNFPAQFPQGNLKLPTKSVPQGFSGQKKHEPASLSNLNIPKGLTIQPPRPSSINYWQGSDALPKRNVGDSGNFAERIRNTGGSKLAEQSAVDFSKRQSGLPKTSVLEKPEKEASDRHHDFSEEDEDYESSSLETPGEFQYDAESFESPKHFIPPGITLERTKQLSSPIRPATPSSPVLNMVKKSPRSPQFSQSAPSLSPRPRPIRNTNPLPFNPLPVTPRKSPVRAVAPRPAKHLPTIAPTHITDFLEQQMSIGNQEFGQNRKKLETHAPLKMNLSEANQLLEQFLKPPQAKPNVAQSLQLPPGISLHAMKGLPTKLNSEKSETTNSGSVLPIMPPGITFEKKMYPTPVENFNTARKEEPQMSTSSVFSVQSSTVSNVQLPPGISLQKKQVPTQFEKLPFEVDDENEEMDSSPIDEMVDESEKTSENENFADDDHDNVAQEVEEGEEEQFEEDQDYDDEPDDQHEEGNQETLAEDVPVLDSSDEPAYGGEGEMGDKDYHDEDEEAELKLSEEANDKMDSLDFDNLISSSGIVGDQESAKGLAEHTGAELEMDDKDMMQNFVDMMAKGEIEGEIQDDKEETEEEDDEGKSGKRKSNEEMGDSSPKKAKGEDDEPDEEDGEGDESDIDKSKVTGSHLRKNIREVMDESKLDEATLAAQRQEAERLKRIQDQQRIIREVQRQIQQSKQSEKTQAKVLSLLQSNSQTSILKTSSTTQASTSSLQSPNHVLLKMGNGQQTSLSDKMRELLKCPGRSEPTDAKDLLGMVSSSVTIAPVKKEPVDEEKKKKKGDVVTLSSDSDDDCIVLSEEEMESEPDEDPTNSGMHTNDRYNVPDEQGRVLVNTTHPTEEPDIFLAPQIARIIKPHQIGGIRFLYDNIIESLERYNTSAGFGCILAHSMGLGKTLQIVSFSDIFLRHTSAKKILCIMPINTIQNWLAEYNLWTPKEHADPEVRCRPFEIYVVNESLKNVHSRGKVILEWDKKGGVLLMGYELFRLLSLKKPIKSKRKRPDEVEEERNRELVEEIYRALVKPGPDLVICDEGHRIKNSHATTSQALKQISTRRRVVLTGYPLQNNLLEYWCMVDFVRPNYLGSKAEFSNMFERPIQNGQCIDSTPQDKRLMRYRAHVLHSLLEGFVQRRSHAVLQQALPRKEEYVLMLRFTPFQKKVYDTFMNDVVRTVAVPNPLRAFAVCCKIWNHPDVLFNFMKKKEEQIDLDLEEALPPSGIPPRPSVDFGFGGMGFGAPSIPPALPAPAWPKRGPGSRGGKIRQPAKRKGQSMPPAAEAAPSPQQLKPPPENPLPSMSNFQVQSSPYSNQAMPDGVQQPNFLQGQQQSTEQKKHNFQQNSYTSPSYSSSQSMFGNDTAMYGNNHQAAFGNSEFPAANFDSDMGSNFYQGQQFQQSSVGNNPQYQTGNVDRQYFNRNENSVSSGFEYNQSTSEFNQVPDFSGADFDNGNFDGGGNTPMDFPSCSQQQNLPHMDQQQQYWGNNWPSCNSGNYSGGSSGDEFISPTKYPMIEGDKKEDVFGGEFQNMMGGPKMETEEKKIGTMPGATTPMKSEVDEKKETKVETPKKEDMPHEWAVELFKNYVTGVISNSSKMVAFFLILEESIKRKDRMLLFSQSLLTLDLIEEFLQKRKIPGTEQHWARNRTYFRLDGSTQALEREKLINEFNSNANVKLFLVSTRAGSLGINLVGANRVIVFDASWNPCHDTQAVCRVYRYGQQKPCYVYRFVMDCCLEKKIYDRQINKQGMADRVVDELNPDAHLSIKEVTNLCWDDQEETSVEDFSSLRDKYHDDIIKILVDEHSSQLSKAPFQHESLLIDRKEKKLSQAEKRLAKRSYELEKQASNNPKNIYQLFPNNSGGRGFQKPIASVKPMQFAMPPRSKWIPAEVWQKQGMTAQEMTLPVDVVIPTNTPDKTSIILKAGERVMVLKSPKGIYMQLQTGKIIAIRSAFKVGAGEKPDENKASQIASALKNNPNVTITHKSAQGSRLIKTAAMKQASLDKKAAAVNMAATKGRVALLNKARTVGQRPGLKVTSKKEELSGTKEEKTPSVADARIGGEHSELLKNLVGDGEKIESEAVKETPGFTAPIGASVDNSLPQPVVDLQHPGAQGIDSSMTATQDMWNQPTQPKNENAPINKLSEGVSDSASSVSKNAYSFNSGQSVLPSTSAKDEDVKKEEDSTRPWQGYPMDPYGNYYPGYYGYGPMPGYEGYPYHQPYPPMPHVKPDATGDASHPAQPTVPHPYPPYPPRGYQQPAVKQEATDNVSPAAAPHHYPPFPPRVFPPAHHPAVPAVKQDPGDGSHSTPPPAPGPMYPPYHAPYPYPYNYPPYPPQTQPPAPSPAPSVKPDAPETTPYTPPYAPRPPYPSAPAPPFYPNYPPYRPYHDPNYPYPNYNPYMPPGYGYPMQGPVQHQMQHHQASDATSTPQNSSEAPT